VSAGNHPGGGPAEKRERGGSSSTFRGPRQVSERENVDLRSLALQTAYSQEWTCLHVDPGVQRREPWVEVVQQDRAAGSQDSEGCGYFTIDSRRSMVPIEEDQVKRLAARA
jgi:hypothetical protein